jgi:CHAD domain-containing protein
VRRFARGRIDKAFNKLALWIDRPPEGLTDSELHRVRILFKRLRYMCEFFRPLLGDDGGRLIGSFVGFQDCLGVHQDATAALHMLSGFLVEVPTGSRSEGFLLSMGAMLQVQRDIQRAQRARFARQWKSAPGIIDLWKGVRGALRDTE